MKSVRRHCLASSLAAVLCLAPVVMAVDKKTPPPKTHVLFMGADLVVQREKKPYRVEDVTGSEFMIRVGQNEVFVPTRNRQTGLQVAYNLKLSGASVKLDQLQSGPAYTPENDPMRKLQESANNDMVIQGAQDLTQYQLAREIAVRDAVAGSLENARPEARASIEAELGRAEIALGNTGRQMQAIDMAALGDFNNVGAGAHRMQLAEGNFDAMEVSFKISSEVELNRPYMVILFKFHEPGAKPGVDGMVVHAEALDPIGAKPRYVRVLRGGLPPGFKFMDCSVHIYNRGREVATNSSNKRVELSRDEARQYLVMEYVGANKGTTAAAAGMPGSLAVAERQRLSRDQLTRKFYARISKDGALLGVYSDEECKVPFDDAATTAALGEVFFKPALEQGKAVDSVAHLRLADF